jgi:hypothetical protein
LERFVIAVEEMEAIWELAGQGEKKNDVFD